jgi:hypothetical protein
MSLLVIFFYVGTFSLVIQPLNYRFQIYSILLIHFIHHSVYIHSGTN